MWIHGAQVERTCEVGLRAAGLVAGAAEGPGGAGVTVLRLWAASTETPHLTVRPIHHLYELSHPGGGGQQTEATTNNDVKKNKEHAEGRKKKVYMQIMVE